MQRSRLGKGLSSLIPTGDVLDSVLKTNVHVTILSIDQIATNPEQPRRFFDEVSLQELSDSIQSFGVLQPILVRQVENNNYIVIAGERRLRASKMAGLNSIPVIIKEISQENNHLEISIIENIQRKDLNVIEEAGAYKKLIDEFHYTHDQLSDVLKKSRSHITNLLRLLLLPERIQEAIKKKQISMGHARALVNARNSDKVLDKIIEEKMSVRQTESLVREDKERLKQKKSEETIALEQKLSSSFKGMDVNIEEPNADSPGKLIFKFMNIEELQFLLQRFVEK